MKGIFGPSLSNDNIAFLHDLLPIAVLLSKEENEFVRMDSLTLGFQLNENGVLQTVDLWKAKKAGYTPSKPYLYQSVFEVSTGVQCEKLRKFAFDRLDTFVYPSLSNGEESEIRIRQEAEAKVKGAAKEEVAQGKDEL